MIAKCLVFLWLGLVVFTATHEDPQLGGEEDHVAEEGEGEVGQHLLKVGAGGGGGEAGDH